MKPNIFSYVSSELSQDAFFILLLNWARPDIGVIDKQLNAFAIKFVTLLLGNDSVNINKISIKRQRNKFDIVAIVNDKYLIAIEDKVRNRGFIKQYEKSVEVMREYCKKHNLMLSLIYLKTCSHPKDEIDEISKIGYKTITRDDMLELYKTDGRFITNVVFQDFFSLLQQLIIEENCFKVKPINEWVDNHNAYLGLFSYLDKKMVSNGSWGYIPKQNGGFMCRWWGWAAIGNLSIYLIIEKSKLCIKIGHLSDKTKSRTVLNLWHKKVMNHATLKGYDEIIKPEKLSVSNFMTIAVVKSYDWLGRGDEIFNGDKVVRNLNKYEKFIEELAKLG